MAVYDSRSGIEAFCPPPFWACVLLGIVLIAAGALALSEVVLATIKSVKLIGRTAIAALSFARWRQNGRMILISGIFGTLAGVLILFGFLTISLWALGVLLGVNLISHGLGWPLHSLRFLRTTA